MKKLSNPTQSLSAPHLYLQLTSVAIEQSAVNCAEYIYTIGSQFSAEQLIFVDESTYDWHTTYCGRAWAIEGQQAVNICFFMQGERYVFSYACPFL